MNENTLSPISSEERIQAIDLLRGLAMFGVLWSNLNDWYGTTATEPTTTLDIIFYWIQYNLIESRFYTILIILFGIGFGIQLIRAAEKNIDIKYTYLCRSMALLIIGIIHAFLIWSGDILALYALVSFSLLFFRNLSIKKILLWTILIWFLAPYFVNKIKFLTGWKFNYRFISGPFLHLYSDGSWLQIESIRISSVIEWYSHWIYTFYFYILAGFLFGLWLYKSKYLAKFFEDRKFTFRVLVIAIVLAAIGYLPDEFFNMIWPPLKVQPTKITDPYFWYPRGLVMRLFYWPTEGTAIVYASLLILIWQKFRNSKFLHSLADTGRMALTTYLAQSIVCTILFYNYGFGLYGKVSFTGQLIITLILFPIQMIFSSWWLKRFKFGPAEWLWRRLTYGKPLQMKIVKPVV